MRITYTTEPAPDPGRRNEDYVIAGPDWIAVLDGATAPQGVESGCVHDVPWLVAHLGAALARQLSADPEVDLPDALAAAIRATMAAHEATCDLTNADSPSSTAAIVRRRAGRLDYLVLCDSPIALRSSDGRITVVDDDRTAHLPGGRPYSRELVRSLRNQAGGFWVASTRPEAAREALTGSVDGGDLDGVLMVTDGVSRLVEWYGHTWESLASTAKKDGPSRLVELVRAAEREHGPKEGVKVHDDATAAWVSW
ncbi:protein phosphatase 2C domain-containing protein [Nonomuraea sp. CA-143628]|uniref:protein phosphatase 2C domain-containing protein n=1 Tax=Nonomuraea sp. CA-143628 TaxID=3239997 RepID=UPI003D8B2654